MLTLPVRPFIKISLEGQVLIAHLHKTTACPLSSLQRRILNPSVFCLYSCYKIQRTLSTVCKYNVKTDDTWSRLRQVSVVALCSYATDGQSSSKSRRDKQIAKTRKGGDVTIGKKVVQAGRDMTYLGIIIAGIGITALMFFTIGQEIFSSKSPNSVYTKALKICKNNDQVLDTFGEPLKGYGEMNRRGRRRHVSHQEYEKDGVRYMRMRFYIEGPSGVKGTVHVEVKEGENGKYQYRYMFVDVDRFPGRPIVIEDNR